MTTDFKKNKADSHLQNLVRQVREHLQDNNPVMAYVCLKILENYLGGLDMQGRPWNAE